MQEVLGIEAARMCIVNEIREIMDNYGIDTNVTHLELLADIMTSRGRVYAVTRHGIVNMKESVLTLASFEETNKHLFKAAFNHTQDTVDGVSPSIISGHPVPLGTGQFKVL